MAQYVDFTLTFTDNSSGSKNEDGTEVQIYTDSPSYKATEKIDYAHARHTWMKLPLVAAGATSVPIRLKAPVTFVKVRCRQFNAHGLGPWNSPGFGAGELFSLTTPEGADTPPGPSNIGLVVVGAPITPPPPPIDPPPPPPPPGGTATNYVFTTQFSGVQGQSGWSYRDSAGNLLTYDSASQHWRGDETYLAIWNGGFHHGFTGSIKDAVLRWTAPSNGTAKITGVFRLYVAGSGATSKIKHNSTEIFSQLMVPETDYAYDETEVMVAGDTIDFILHRETPGVNNNTALNPSIAFTTDGSTPTNPVVASITPASLTANTGTVNSARVSLSSPAIENSTITLSSSASGVASVPASIVIPIGALSEVFDITAVAIGSATITASYNSTTTQCAVTVVTPPIGSQWPNEPAGMTLVTDTPFSDTFPAEWFNIYNTFPFASPGGSGVQFSAPRALDMAMAAGSSQGNGQWGLNLPTRPREIYCGVYWSTNAEFQGSINTSNKMMFFRDPNIDNSLIHWGGLQDQPRVIRWYWQTVYSNAHVSGFDGGPSGLTGYLVPNINAAAATVAAGSGWHFIELYLKCSTSLTSRDGIIRWWVNRTLCGSYTNVNLTPTGFSEFHLNGGWDGSPPFTAAGRDMSRAWHHYWDHIRISRRP